MNVVEGVQSGILKGSLLWVTPRAVNAAPGHSVRTAIIPPATTPATRCSAWAGETGTQRRPYQPRQNCHHGMRCSRTVIVNDCAPGTLGCVSPVDTYLSLIHI